MSFANPLLLLTLLVIPVVIVGHLLAERRRMRYAVRFTNMDVLASVIPAASWRRFIAPVLFLAAVGGIASCPARPKGTTQVASERATVILVIDVSRSMEARDVKPSRIGAAQAAVEKFLNQVPSRLRIALIAFAGEPQVATPPTTDHDLIRQSLGTIQSFSGFGGTAIGDALAAAVELGQQATGQGANGSTIAYRTAPAPGARGGLVSILFLSDGAQTRGTLEPLQGAERAREAGFPVYTVALGTPNGTLNGGGFGGGCGFFGTRRVPPDPETLRAIAATTGGRFVEARNAETLDSAYASLGSKLGRTAGKKEVTYAFLGAALVLLLLAGVVSVLRAPRLP
jgi:Ca-activated chloride channel homolog